MTEDDSLKNSIVYYVSFQPLISAEALLDRIWADADEICRQELWVAISRNAAQETPPQIEDKTPELQHRRIPIYSKDILDESELYEPPQIREEELPSYKEIPTAVCERDIFVPSPEYMIGMSDHFIKSIKKIDANLRGRIVLAMGDLSRRPTSIQGDTIKPLTGNMRGFWRYRIGDYRLVYQPDEERQQVMLIDFDSRGSIYER